MSQDIRDYELFRVDEMPNEALMMSLTATVGPSGHGEIEDRRGVQITLNTPAGFAYARLSEPQVRDLIEVLQKRVDPDNDVHEATGWEAERVQISPGGSRKACTSDTDTGGEVRNDE